MTHHLKPELDDFPFESQFENIYGSQLHFIQEGTGNPVLFLHGNPTWSYLWRNVIPEVKEYGKCIAVDLIGFGFSGKPDIDYHLKDHYTYISKFVEQLDLNNLTIVGHDWGGMIGLMLAKNHPSRVNRIAVMEAAIPPVFPKHRWSDMGQFESLFRGFRDPKLGRTLIEEGNEFIESFLPNGILRDLSEKEHDAYRIPFRDPATRKPIRIWPQELPIDGEPTENHHLFKEVQTWWTETTVPKLLIHASPGLAVTEEVVEWSQVNLKNLTISHVGSGLHYLQEDCPTDIGRALAAWISHNEIQFETYRQESNK